MDAVFSGLIGAGGSHSPLVRQAADNHRLSLERWVKEDFDGRKKGVDVNVDNIPAVHSSSFSFLFKCEALCAVAI
jgi:hypothetical protein